MCLIVEYVRHDFKKKRVNFIEPPVKDSHLDFDELRKTVDEL